MTNEEKPKKPIYKKWWFWLIVVIVVLAIGSSANENNTQPTSANSTANSETSTPSTNEAQAIDYVKVSTDELDSALEKNSAVAKDTYNGQYVEVTGRLGTIDADLKYISLYSTTDEYDLVGMNCYIKNNEQKEVVKTLSKDDTVVVRGKITNVGEVLGYSLDIIEIVK